jgi:response regulator of citrate/malate metabolism
MESTIGIRCVIVEDQAMFAELLASLLRVSPGIPLQIVETVRTVAAGKAACELRRPDLLLLDIALPDGSGLTVLEHLIAVHPEGRAIVV